MKRKFKGSFNELKKAVARTSSAGDWRHRGNYYQFRASNGAVLNWWESTRTINFQGPEGAAHDLELSINRVATLVGEETTGWKRC
jgi:hypothetical protein